MVAPRGTTHPRTGSTREPNRLLASVHIVFTLSPKIEAQLPHINIASFFSLSLPRCQCCPGKSSLLQYRTRIQDRIWIFCFSKGVVAAMAIKHGELVTLEELNPSSPFFKQGASVRVTGKLQQYTVETAIAVVADGNATLKIDTQHLRDISFRMGSVYQFIGELLIQPDSEAILQARVGRIADGIDLSLYPQSLQLLRQVQADHLNNSAG
ncbi:PREDICTED: uncharacterized protein LOC105134261 isoform X1 [Populus euphratica]|uniref:Uncharacterized protein LOC105134261 isoform X1 n=2 Tax=Populus euphratica TaxID=75702 RepID=A0AAJ6XZP3_POPEU|nr:PREDICTED: uncharacterized protein LOC105134261 isoform X1 [Populus euphratica]